MTKQITIGLDITELDTLEAISNFIRVTSNTIESCMIKHGQGIILQCYISNSDSAHEDFDRLKSVIGSILSEVSVDKEYNVSCNLVRTEVESPDRASAWVVGHYYTFSIQSFIPTSN